MSTTPKMWNYINIKVKLCSLIGANKLTHSEKSTVTEDKKAEVLSDFFLKWSLSKENLNNVKDLRTIPITLSMHNLIIDKQFI